MRSGFVDGYTLLHAASGVIAFFWGVPLDIWLVLHILFEWLENTPTGMRLINKTWWPGGKTHADALINRVGDVLAGALGWYVAALVMKAN